MTRDQKKLRLKRRRAHGPQQRQRVEAALAEAEQKAKAQKKGAKQVEAIMNKRYWFDGRRWRARAKD